jgi:hypothetical protein
MRKFLFLSAGIAGILDRGHVRAGLYGQRTNWYANAGVAYRF